MTITVKGPDGSSFAFPDGTPEGEITGAMAKHYGEAAAAPVDEPVTTNKVVRAAATGVPLVGGVLNKLNAATNATLAPVVEPFLAPSESDISRKGEGWRERYAKSEAMQNLADKKFEEAHPIIDTSAKVAGGVAGSLPIMMAAPAAFGLTGTLPQMVGRGAVSNAALGGADALIRGESPVVPAAVGGGLGAAAPLVARGVGAVVRGVKDYRNPVPPVAQTVEEIAGVKVPMNQTSDPAIEAKKEIYRRGAGGREAEAVALRSDEEARAAIGQAEQGISTMLDPTGVVPRTVPIAAAEAAQTELAAQAAARESAAQQQALQVAGEGENLARGLGGGAAPVTSVLDAAERTGAAVAARRDAKVAATREAYRARDAVPGTFDESVPRGLSEDIRERLNTGDNPIWVDPTNESVANRALKLIDQTLGRDTGVFSNAAGPKAPAAAPGAAPAVKMTEDETVAALRAKFGDSVADAYVKQNQPPPLSLLEFIASKGGLSPHAELDAIGLGHGHRAQIPGQKGFFGTVRKNGADIDRMREAAEEAGYLRGAHGETSTPTQFLDAIEAELRGQKKYPEGFEGFKSKKETVGRGAREQAELDQVLRGHEQDLAAAGHGGLAPDLRQRAVALMHEEGMAADDAVEQAFRQLEQEDAAAVSRGGGDFPGDRAAPVARVRGPVDLKAMDEARKRLVTMYGDAKSAAIRTGDKSDMRAMGKILGEFDNSIADALGSGKFSGDAALAKELQDAARKSHAEYRQTFSSRGPGDEIGRNVEKILGRYADTAATPEQVLKISYGPHGNPGTGAVVKTALRLREILGANSPEWAQYKQGLFAYVDDASLSPAKRAARIDNFLNTSMAKGVLSDTERASMSRYSRSVRSQEPRSTPLSALERDISRIDGTDGRRPATVDEVSKMITAGTGDSQRLVGHLKTNLTPEGFSRVKQGIFDDLVNAPAGHNEFTALQKSKRLSDYLESGVSKVANTAAERAEMAKLASVYKRMVPIPGTTNPSGTAPMLTKVAKKASENLLALIGFGAHGVTGAIVGHALQKGGSAVRDANAGKEAVRLFYGPQARRAIKTGRLPQIIAPAAVGASQR